MSLYLIQIILILISYPLFYRKFRLFHWEISEETAYLCVASFILVIPMILRSYEVGVDTETYYFIYDRISKSDDVNWMFATAGMTAPIYVVYVILLSRFFLSAQVITIVNSMIIILGMAIFIKRTSKDVFFSVVTYIVLALYYESMNGARQMMSLVLVLNAFVYFSEENKSIKGWILFLFAVGIHPTAIIFAVSLLGIRIVEKSYSVGEVVWKSVIMSLGFVVAFSLLLNLFVSIFPRYSMYIDGSNSASILSQDGGGRIVLLYIVLAVVVFVYGIFVYNSKLSGTIQEKMLPCVVFCVVSGICFSKNILFNRLLWFFMALFITFIPNVYQEIKGRLGINKYVIYIVTFIVLSVFTVLHLIEDKSGIIPYEFFWEEY